MRARRFTRRVTHINPSILTVLFNEYFFSWCSSWQTGNIREFREGPSELNLIESAGETSTRDYVNLPAQPAQQDARIQVRYSCKSHALRPSAGYAVKISVKKLFQ